MYMQMLKKSKMLYAINCQLKVSVINSQLKIIKKRKNSMLGMYK